VNGSLLYERSQGGAVLGLVRVTFGYQRLFHVSFNSQFLLVVLPCVPVAVLLIELFRQRGSAILNALDRGRRLAYISLRSSGH